MAEIEQLIKLHLQQMAVQQQQMEEGQKHTEALIVTVIRWASKRNIFLARP